MLFTDEPSILDGLLQDIMYVLNTCEQEKETRCEKYSQLWYR